MNVSRLSRLKSEQKELNRRFKRHGGAFAFITCRAIRLDHKRRINNAVWGIKERQTGFLEEGC